MRPCDGSSAHRSWKQGDTTPHKEEGGEPEEPEPLSTSFFAARCAITNYAQYLIDYGRFYIPKFAVAKHMWLADDATEAGLQAGQERLAGKIQGIRGLRQFSFRSQGQGGVDNVDFFPPE